MTAGDELEGGDAVERTRTAHIHSSLSSDNVVAPEGVTRDNGADTALLNMTTRPFESGRRDDLHDDSRERRRERLHAERLLAKMDDFEEFAVEARYGEADDSDGEFWDRRTAMNYQRAVGVSPSRRHRLREGLENIRAGSRQRIVDLVAEINLASGAA